MGPKVWRSGVVVVVAVALAASCSGTYEDDASFDESSETVSRDGGWVGEDESREWDDTEGLYADELSTVGEAVASDAPAEPPDVQLVTTAGNVDDNELWDEYLLYRQAFDALGIPVSRISVEGRQILTVTDDSGAPVVGADVVVTDESGATVSRLRTYSDGRALFHAPPGVDPDSQDQPRYTAQVSKGGLATTLELAGDALEHTVVLEGAANSPPALDVLFLVDGTGSMSDEIERLKANLISISEQMEALPASPDVRFAMTVYRDQGEAFVTRTFDFTDDVTAFSEAIAEVTADGGGDTPESLNAGLHEALTLPAWRTDDTVKLVFLIADAPPHLSGEPGYESEPDYADDVIEAAARGIKIFPVASSGLDDQGEYVFRQLAQITMAEFVFLTYGSDGAGPGEHTPHSVAPEDYSVLALDELVVALVADELAPLS